MSIIHVKPEVTDVRRFLAETRALIVHFSGCPPGVGVPRNFRFPDDLKNVVSGGAITGVSCSLVKPGDRFHGLERQSTGTVGVILDLRAPASLVAVSACDCGSYEDERGYRRAYEQDIAVTDLQSSLSERTRYNEWVVQDYLVRGIFVAEPIEVWQPVKVDIPPEAPHSLQHTAPFGIIEIEREQVFTHFPDRNVYSFRRDRIVDLRNGAVVPHSTLYPSTGS